LLTLEGLPVIECNMYFASRFTQAYFNFVYNPVYDFTTKKLPRYQELQKGCLAAIEFRNSDAVLCVGLGTGNEIIHIFQRNPSLSLTGIDYSPRALKKAAQKARSLGRDITLNVMDARRLEFRDNSFDKVVCIHVMDFIVETDQATQEIFRVLKPGGQFVITFPSSEDDLHLGFNLIRDEIKVHREAGWNILHAWIYTVGHLFAGMVYLPLYWRTQQKGYSRDELAQFLARKTSTWDIDGEPVYHDWIAHGSKSQ
jgi:ubiquinone/menaquinone biosynthesis C-methylase UbiE